MEKINFIIDSSYYGTILIIVLVGFLLVRKLHRILDIKRRESLSKDIKREIEYFFLFEDSEVFRGEIEGIVKKILKKEKKQLKKKDKTKK